MYYYQTTKGGEIRNSARLFWILQCNIFSSKNHVICSFTDDAPAVGSGAPFV